MNIRKWLWYEKAKCAARSWKNRNTKFNNEM